MKTPPKLIRLNLNQPRKLLTPQLAKRIAEGLIPELQTRAALADEMRKVPPENIALLNKSGLLRTLQPASCGGQELSLRAHVDVVSTIAKGCNATAWVSRDNGRRVQLGVRIDGTRTGHPFKTLVPVCQGEVMLQRDAAVGANAESGKSLMGVTGVGCAIGTALVIVPIVIGIVYAMAKC